jgi:hypothetical protein
MTARRTFKEVSMVTILLLLLTVVILGALFVVMMTRTPSTFLFDLIGVLFSHDHPSRQR